MEMQPLSDMGAPEAAAITREWDMVLVFPIVEKGSLRTFEEYAASMLGLRWMQMVNKQTGELESKDAQKLIAKLSAKDLVTTETSRMQELNDAGVDRFQDSAREVFKTDRCFMDDQNKLGNELRKKSMVAHDNTGKKRKQTLAEREDKAGEVIHARIDLLRGQWDRNVEAIREQYKKDGLPDPVIDSNAVPPAVFSRCVAKALARRLQQACGLTTEMVYSVDKDEIIMKVPNLLLCYFLRAGF